MIYYKLIVCQNYSSYVWFVVKRKLFIVCVDSSSKCFRQNYLSVVRQSIIPGCHYHYLEYCRASFRSSQSNLNFIFRIKMLSFSPYHLSLSFCQFTAFFVDVRLFFTLSFSCSFPRFSLMIFFLVFDILTCLLFLLFPSLCADTHLFLERAIVTGSAFTLCFSLYSLLFLLFPWT